jgi:hypothetical protein
MKMQQTKSYWRFVAVAGVVSAFIASACVVTTDPDYNSAGAGGKASAGAGGAATGGASTAGKAGANAAGATAAAGAGAGEGGAGPTPFQCDPPGDGGAVGMPLSCADTEDSDCQKCIQTSCCEEYSACYAFDPGNQCGWGGPDKLPSGAAYAGGEALCIQLCTQEGVEMSGTEPDAELLGTCAANCNTASDTSGATCKSTIGQQTNDLIFCMSEHCSQRCFGPFPP